MTLLRFNHYGLTTNKFSVDIAFLLDIVLNLLDMSDA